MYYFRSKREKIYLNAILSHAKIIIILFVFLFSFSTSSAQKIRITKILDSNLFETSDSIKIKLAGVDVPNINHPNKQLKEVGIEAFEYAKSNLNNRPFDININRENFIDSSYYLVTLIREYPLATKDYTEEYLIKGFGKYVCNLNEIDSMKYIAAENEAVNDKKGIWNLTDIESSEIFENPHLSTLITENYLTDSLEVYGRSSYFKELSITARIPLEIVASPVVGVATSFLGLLAGGVVTTIFNLQGWEMLGYAILGGYACYVVGSSAGVYYVARNGEREVDFGGTLFSGIVGAAIGVAIFYSGKDVYHDEFKTYAPLIFPGVVSILYANLLAPKNHDSEINLTNFQNINKFQKDFITYQDIYNSKKLIEINLFRIKF